jgi:hypothetical protein
MTIHHSPSTMALIRAQKEHMERISATLNTIFIQFREATWHTHVMEVQTGGHQIMLYLSEQKPFRRHGWWSMFPSHIVGLADEQNKNAVLTTMAIHDVARLTQLISQMFEATSHRNVYIRGARLVTHAKKV